jgi:hypothetical protein
VYQPQPGKLGDIEPKVNFHVTAKFFSVILMWSEIKPSSVHF